MHRTQMKLVATVLSLAASALALGYPDAVELAERQSSVNEGNLIEICPNQNYEGLNETITCMNITDPTQPKGYGGRTCISLTFTPLRVGSPQGVSSARMFGERMNCTLYKTETCLPDSPENGFVIPQTGAAELPLATVPSDPYAMDDQTVAFNCKPWSL
ncbi:hypothetical protein KJ359_013285 [Pestalotiopsis sp. 9143b]|nr:hypothetical protein KJ359_013285 [Pestalotiopsis sp. 9143b]